MRNKKSTTNIQGKSQYECEEEKWAPFFDTLVLEGFRVVKLKRLVQDSLDIMFELDEGLNGKIYRMSMLLPVIPLKGYILNHEYEGLVYYWNEGIKRFCEEKMVK